MAQYGMKPLDFWKHYSNLPKFVRCCLAQMKLNNEAAFAFLLAEDLNDNFFVALLKAIQKLASVTCAAYYHGCNCAHCDTKDYVESMKTAYDQIIISPGLKSSIRALRAIAVQNAKINNLY